MSVRKRISVVILLLAVVIPSRPADGQAFRAQGTWTSADGQSNGTWQAGFDAAGTDISGSFAITGMPSLSQGNITGTLSNGTIDFGVLYNDRQAAEFNGMVTGATVSGTFTAPDGVAGQWSGLLGTAAPTLPPTNIPSPLGTAGLPTP